MKISVKPFLFFLVMFSIILSACTPAISRPVEIEATLTNTIEPTSVKTELPTLIPTLIPTNTQVPATATATVEPTSEPTEATDLNFRINEKDRSEQIYIPAGEFLMGTNDKDAQHTLDNGVAYPEVPMHTVYLDGYWIDKYEVTNGRYALCVEDGGCKPPWINSSYTRANYYGNPEYDNYPVIMVDWWMAKRFCEWAGGKLPTEAEWEKAARGTDGRRFPWGDEPISGDKANFCDINCPKDHANPTFDDGYGDTAPVGSYPNGASPYGLMDTIGNVWEWTSTIPMLYPYDPNDGREADDGYLHIWRGGPWSNGIWWERASLRYKSVPKYWYNNLGFRCAADN